MPKTITMPLWEFGFFSICDDEYVSAVLKRTLDIEEEDLLVVVNRLGPGVSNPIDIFTGRVCSVWVSERGTQVIHAVSTSTTSVVSSH